MIFFFACRLVLVMGGGGYPSGPAYKLHKLKTSFSFVHCFFKRRIYLEIFFSYLKKYMSWKPSTSPPYKVFIHLLEHPSH